MFKKRVSEEHACQLVLQHMQLISALSDKQFPENVTLAEQAVNYVLDTLRAEHWLRITRWDQKCKFTTFLTVVVNRLLIDYRRQQFGYHRAPKWIKDQLDPLYSQAYELLIKKKFSRTEALEILTINNPTKEHAYIDHVIGQVLAHCKQPEKPVECELEHFENWLVAAAPGPLAEMEQDEALKIVAIKQRMLNWDVYSPDDDMNDSSFREIERKFSQKVDEQDKLIMKMYFIDGRKLNEIKRMLNFHGDIHKRYNKILNQCREALRCSGLLQEE